METRSKEEPNSSIHQIVEDIVYEFPVD
ncbi:hypothetical protein [Rossellomorea aquimaris]